MLNGKINSEGMKHRMIVSQEGESGVLRQLLYVGVIGVVAEKGVRSEMAVS